MLRLLRRRSASEGTTKKHSGDALPVLDGHVLAITQGERSVLLDTRLDEYFGLNATATTMLAGVRAGKSIGEIADAVAMEFDVPRDVAERDAADFVQSLSAEGLVTKC